jgi:hypothetical protein
METLKNHAGTIGWGLLAAYVIAWDVLAPETLSHAVDRALDHKAMKYVAWGVGGIVSGHLFNVIPEKLDPIQQGANYVGRKLGL